MNSKSISKISKIYVCLKVKNKKQINIQFIKNIIIHTLYGIRNILPYNCHPFKRKIKFYHKKTNF